MRIALFSDVHGNVTALAAVLNKIAALSGETPIDRIYCLGDTLFGHAGGNAVMTLLDEHGVRLIRGNHDESHLPAVRLGAEKTAILQAVHDWLKLHVAPEYLARLETAPIMETIPLEDGRRLGLFHSNPADLWDMTNGADPTGEDLARVFGAIDADVMAYGHYHQEHVMWFQQKLLINVASVDSFVRADQDSLARFTILTSLPDRLVIHNYAVLYDAEYQCQLDHALNVPLLFP